MSESYGMTISVPWRKYLYDEEWNRQQLEAHREGCRKLGARMAREFDERFWEAFMGSNQLLSRSGNVSLTPFQETP